MCCYVMTFASIKSLATCFVVCNILIIMKNQKYPKGREVAFEDKIDHNVNPEEDEVAQR